MVEPGDLVLVAISGGPDSTALVHALHTLREDLECRLHLAHLNHELRGQESTDDAAFVEQMARSLDLPLVTRSAGDALVHRSKDVSLEEAARQLRYEFLEDTAASLGALRIATGHTADDQAETVLMRLVQGAGPSGLAGIRPVRGGRVIRPLLRCRSAEITAYVAQLGVRPRADSTNQDPAFVRNRIRHRLLPLIEREFNPNIVETLGRLASVEDRVSRFLEGLAEDALGRLAVRSPGRIGLALGGFRDYDIALRAFILRAAVGEVRGRLTDVSHEHILAVLGLAERRETPFRQVQLPGSWVARLEPGLLVLAKEDADTEPSPQEIAVPGVTRLASFGLEMETSLVPRAEIGDRATEPHLALFDWDALRPPLRVRRWRRGDRFCPAGMRGTKKLQDFFVDTKIPRPVRSRTPLVVDGETIHWVVGYRTSESSRIRSRTRRVLQMRAVPLTP